MPILFDQKKYILNSKRCSLCLSDIQTAETSFVQKTKDFTVPSIYSLMVFVSIIPFSLLYSTQENAFYRLQTQSYNRHCSKERLPPCITISALLLPFRSHLGDTSILIKEHSSLWTEYSPQSSKPVLLLDLKYPPNISHCFSFYGLQHSFL